MCKIKRKKRRGKEGLEGLGRGDCSKTVAVVEFGETVNNVGVNVNFLKIYLLCVKKNVYLQIRLSVCIPCNPHK